MISDMEAYKLASELVCEQANPLEEESDTYKMIERYTLDSKLEKAEHTSTLRAVNVSTVPQRSPFRYPGGKTWLVPQIRQWLKLYGGDGVTLVEPFAGGGTVTLTAVMEGLTEAAIMIERDKRVAAVWRAILGKSGRKLAEQIKSFEFNEENVTATLLKEPANLRDRAFWTLLKNRVNRNGILNSSAGMLKEGEGGQGIQSRWYPDTIAQRILDIVEFKDKISLKEGDGLRYLQKCARNNDEVYFIDPPYCDVGIRLYEHGEINNERLFQKAAMLNGHFLMTYSNTEQVLQLANEQGFETRTIQMQSGRNGAKTELLIGRDLSWLTNAEGSSDTTK